MDFPETLELHFQKVQSLRYGENPHQQGALYRVLDTSYKVSNHQGKELSYNNIVDADSAWGCAVFIAKQFRGRCVCVIVKHNNPCGVALGNTYLEAYEKAFSTDKVSAFGGIIAFSGCASVGDASVGDASVGDDVIAKILANQFVEVIVAGGFTDAALEAAKTKGNVRVLEMPGDGLGLGDGIGESVKDAKKRFEIKSVYDGDYILYQSIDDRVLVDGDLVVKSARSPDAGMLEQMRFAWCVAKYVKSNAIVFVRDWMTIGIGAGQMSRVDSTRLAIMKAGVAGLDVAGCVVASDAFFPFRDGVDAILDSGAIGIIQPGGSIKDKEVLAAVDERNAVMVMTGVRHFRH